MRIGRMCRLDPMRLSSLLAVVVLVTFTSQCERARTLIKKAEEAGGSESLPKSIEGGGTDPSLQALVDQTAGGVIFRKDLPFPQNIEVRYMSRLEVKNARGLSQSALGVGSASISGNSGEGVWIERFPGAARLTFLKEPVSIQAHGVDSPVPDGHAGGAADRVEGGEAVIEKTGPVVFRYDGERWKSDRTRDILLASRMAEMEETMPTYLASAGAAPRPLWFSTRRYRPGDSLKLEGGNLEMMIDGVEGGVITLTMEAVEEIDGHPCGRFKVEGNYKLRGHLMPDGQTLDSDATITRGTAWFSLIYPIILREEYETVQTMRAGKDGSGFDIQGAMDLRHEREWKVVER